jgi:hypothetical protein
MIELPKIPPVEKYDFHKLLVNLEKNVQKLRIGNNTKPNSYEDDVKYFQREWLGNGYAVPLTGTQLRSVSMHLMESDRTFNLLVQKNSLITRFLKLLADATSISNQKRLVQLFFQYYHLFNIYRIEIREYLESMLLNFSGHNLLLNEYKMHLNDIFHPKKLIDDMDLNEIVQKFVLSSNSEYYRTLLILELIKKVNALEPGVYDIKLFDSIRIHKDYMYDEHTHVGEYAVRKLIEKMMITTNIKYAKWVTYIIDLIGDPRTVSVTTAHNIPWGRVGEKYKEFMIRYLSREDLDLFLDVLGDSDPNIDVIYQYRKKFWRNFGKYVQFTKLFITNHKYYELPENIKRRFDRHNSAYSFISDFQRSFIYIDLGEIKIIEGTHNAKVRLYTDSPIDLSSYNFDYTDFYKTSKAIQALIYGGEITHASSEGGYWQEKVLNKIKQYKSVDVHLADTY